MWIMNRILNLIQGIVTLITQSPMTIGFILFDNLTQLDLTAPYEVFSRLPNTQVCLIAEKKAPVKSDSGLAIMPDTNFKSCPQLDIICVPGGPGIGGAIENKKLMAFLKKQAQQAQYITSVCTGALVLAAADLLRGYAATTHWLSMDLLGLFPEIIVKNERVVIDRNRITGGGVTAGLDFALVLAAKIYGENTAKEIQLMLEYNPAPPFNCGSPENIEKQLLEKIIAERITGQTKRKELILTILNT